MPRWRSGAGSGWHRGSPRTAAGYHRHQRPYDGFWGARYAIVDDPDGNAAGLMSPVEADRKFWSPTHAPST